MIIDPRLPERIAMLMMPEPNYGCWLFIGHRTSRNGYARAYWEGRYQQLHRVVWKILVGPICPTFVLDHTCRVRCCANPAHLAPVTSGVNTARGRATLFRPLAHYV